MPPRENCSRCRSGKFCPIDGHAGNDVSPDANWKGPAKLDKRAGKKNK